MNTKQLIVIWYTAITVLILLGYNMNFKNSFILICVGTVGVLTVFSLSNKIQIEKRHFLQWVLPAIAIAFLALAIPTNLPNFTNQQKTLPVAELAKLSTEAYIDNEWLFIKLYNGSLWNVHSITVAISSGRDEKQRTPERVYKLNCQSEPLTFSECKTNSGIRLGKEERLFGHKISAEGQPKE
jgi:hypothetical protein